jgi:hypothetical protein
MFRLRYLLVVIWVACIAGAFVIGAMTFGWVGWRMFVAAGVVGLVLGVPAGIWNARYIKREDPMWPPRRPPA